MPEQFTEWPDHNPVWEWSETPSGTGAWWPNIPKHLRSPDPTIYERGSYVVLDFETSNEDKGNPTNPDNTIICAGWVCGSSHRPNKSVGKTRVPGWYKFGGEYSQELLVSHIESSDFVVAHNAKFELGWLARCGYDVGSRPVWCTQVAEYVIRGNRQQYALDLDTCAKRRGFSGKSPIIKKMWDLGITTADIPRSLLLPYLKSDVYETWEVFKSQLHYILQYHPSLLQVVFTRCLTTPVLADVEKNGVHISASRVASVHAKMKREHIALEREFVSKYGDCNWRSRVDKDRLLYKDLAFDIPKVRGKELITKALDPEDKSRYLGQTNEAALDALKAKTPEQKAFIKIFRELQKKGSQLSKYLDKFKIVCEKYDEKLHAQFNQTASKTHRLTSSGLKPDTKIQFQNVDAKFKPLIGARSGWLIGEADASQLEWVTAVQLSQDVHGLNTILSKEDRHAFTAEKIFAEKFTNATGVRRKKIRTEAKAHTFKPLFGGTSGTKAEQKYYKAFREEFPTLASAQESWASEVLRKGKLQLSTGLLAYWPGTRMTQSGISNKTKIYNYPIQSVATADVVPIASVYIWHAMRAMDMDSFITNFVHDSVLAELEPSEVEIWTDITTICFTSVVYWYLTEVYDYAWVVPLNAEVDVAEYWTDTPEWREEWL